MASLEEEARKEISKMKQAMQTLKVAERKQDDKQAEEMKKLVDSYWIDAQHFLEKKQFLEAFEAAVICWAYVDSGLHLGIFSISPEVKKLFTV